jgi:hypothetical protein
MGKLLNPITIVAVGLAILLLLPVAGGIWAPIRTSEIMGGRMMVWGFGWLVLVLVATLLLLSLAGAAVWRRRRR